MDARDLVSDTRGIGRYLRALLGVFRDEPGLRVRLVVREFPAARAARAIDRLFGAGAFALRRSVPRDADVVWHPWNGTFLRSAKPGVATMHDVAPFAFPHADPRRRAHEQDPFLRSARTAKAFLTVSRFSKAELVARLGVPADAVAVTHLGVDPAFRPGASTRPASLARRIGAETPYVLALGAADARKNLDTAYAAWRAAFPRGEVALVGRGLDPLRHPGAVALEPQNDDEALADLYRGALYAVHPSIYEGFGLPVLEAMACGAPVVAYPGGAVPEVGGDAVRWVEAAVDRDAWAAALLEMAASPELRRTHRERGLLQASRFDWRSTARETLRTLAAACGRDG